jgi:uncharacterized protein (TIGR02265 family)
VLQGVEEDWRAAVESVRPGHRIRGMFIAPIAALLSAEAKARVLTTLDEPPRGGLFVPFISYSRRDYLRIVLAAAENGDASLSLAERLRRISRNDFETFSASVLGLAVRTAVRTAKAAVLRTPWVYDAVAPADDGKVTGGELDDGRLELRFTNYPICWPYHLGQIEGMVQSFGDTCDVDVERDATDVRYLIRIAAR